jgi:hypothetical protein
LSEWKLRGQVHPVFQLVLYAFAMIIVGVICFYSKLVLLFEHQHPLEASYGVNTLLLIALSLIMRVKAGVQAKTLKRELQDNTSTLFVSLDYNPLIVSPDDRLQFFRIALFFMIGLVLMAWDQ